jgi:hypothetical protein
MQLDRDPVQRDGALFGASPDRSPLLRLVARVDLILLVHNLIRSRVLLKVAGVE